MQHPNLTNASCRLISMAKDLKPGGSLTHQFWLFAGPKKPAILENSEYRLGELVYFGWPIFAVVAVPLTKILHCLPRRDLQLRAGHHPVDRSGPRLHVPAEPQAGHRRQKMQLLQPEIKKIAEKHKNNVEARTKAQQELFRKHDYNPLAGCLPIFIQMPVFIGLYRSLMVAIELRDAPLISHAIRWCSNLAAPDMLFDWSGFMPAIWRFIVEGGRFFRARAVLQYFAHPDDRALHRAAEDVHASAHRRAGGHAAEDHEVHDGFHGLDVLQGGQRLVHLFHRVQPVGIGRTQVPAETAEAGRRRRRGNPRRRQGPRPRKCRAGKEGKREEREEGK